MVTPAYIRHVILDVGSFAFSTRVQNLRINFAVYQDVEGTPDPSVIRIYNLARETTDNITGKWTYLRLRAGYREPLDVVVQGEILDVETVPEGLDRVTTIIMSGTDLAGAVGKFVQSYQGTVKLHTILGDIASAIGHTLGDLDSVPNDDIMDFAHTGLASRALDKLLRQRQITWWRHNDVVHFSARNIASARLPRFTLNAYNGLVGSPSRTDTGMKARMLLSGQVTLGQVVNMESETLAGAYKIVKLAHIGDTWEGPFNTEFETVSLPSQA